jgi:3-oxoadipate enol-lactonase
MIYQSGDAQLFYEASGEGPEVVLLHPTPVDHRFWQPLASSLSGYRLLLPDLRGHGRSQAGSSSISIRMLAEDIERLLDRLEMEKAFFVGCSIGGYVLYELWRRSSGRFNGMAIFCSKPQPDSPANKVKRTETIESIQAGGVEGFFEGMTQNLVGASARRRNPELTVAVREMMAMEPEAVIAIQRALGDRPDSVATARTISVPLLAVAGGEDASSTPAEMEALNQAAHGAEYHVVTDGGHFVALEQPERMGALLRRFLDRTLS